MVDQGDGVWVPAPRILLAQRTCAERYPPLLHQAELLQQLGTVSILDSPDGRGESTLQTSESVERVRVWAGRSGGVRAITNLGWAWRYSRAFRTQMARFPAVAVAFEPDAAALLLSSRVNTAQTMRIVHLHEIPDVTLYRDSAVARVSIRFMLRELNRADLVVVADEDRARYTTNAAHLEREPTVVMNCPPVLSAIPKSKLLPWLHERGLGDRRIVHFQGTIGEERGLKAVIASIRYWPADAIFIIVGDGSPALKEELKQLAANENVSDRVLFVGRVSYADVLAFAVGASIGITLMEPTNRNWQFAAGASNKRFEYASLGIPQVTNTGPGMPRLFEATGIAVLVDARNPEMIGRAIDQLLGDRVFAMALGARARALHLSRYNYEAQFAPVLETVTEWLSSHR